MLTAVRGFDGTHAQPRTRSQGQLQCCGCDALLGAVMAPFRMDSASCVAVFLAWTLTVAALNATVTTRVGVCREWIRSVVSCVSPKALRNLRGPHSVQYQILNPYQNGVLDGLTERTARNTTP